LDASEIDSISSEWALRNVQENDLASRIRIVTTDTTHADAKPIFAPLLVDDANDLPKYICPLAFDPSRKPLVSEHQPVSCGMPNKPELTARISSATLILQCVTHRFTHQKPRWPSSPVLATSARML
jgi:hypothetical protein